MSRTFRSLNLALVLALLAAGLGWAAPPVGAQDVDEANQVWSLIPGWSSAVISLNTDPTSGQWESARSTLAAGGLEDLVYGTVSDLVAATGLPASLLDPDQSTLLGDSVTLATWGGASDPMREAALYVKAADPESAYRTLVAVVISDVPSEVLESDVPGGTAAYAVSGEAAVLRIDDVVTVTTARSAQTLIRIATGGAPTIDEFEPFARVIEAQDPDAIARAYLNGPIMGTSLGPVLMNLFNLGVPELGLLLAASGPLVTAQTSLGLTSNEHGFQVRVAQLPAPLIGSDLPPDGASDNLAERVPADAIFFASGTDLGVNPIMTSLVSVLAQVVAGQNVVDPETGQPRDAIADIERQTGINIQTQLLDQLRGDYLVAAAAPAFDVPNDIAAVAVSDVVDPVAMDGLLRLLRLGLGVGAADQIEGLTWDTRDVDGGTLLVLTAGNPGEEVTVSIGVIDEQLVVALGSGFDTLLDPATGDRLADRAEFSEAIEALPAGDGSIAWLDTQQVFVLADLPFLEPSDTSVLPEGPQFASLEGITSLVSSTYEDDGLAITDLVLVIEGAEGSLGQRDIANLSFRVASGEVIATGDLRIMSVSPTGEYFLVDAGSAICVIPVTADEPDPDLCVEDMPGIDRDRVRWSPDGQAVAFTEDVLRLLVDSDLYVIDLAAGTATNLTDDGYKGGLLGGADKPVPDGVFADVDPVWSPDGDRIAFSRTGATDEIRGTDIVVVNLATGEPEEPIRLGDEGLLAWGGMVWTDDDELLLARIHLDQDNPATGLYRLDLESGESERIFGPTDERGFPVILQALDGDRLLIAYPGAATRFDFDTGCPLAVFDPRSGVATDLMLEDSCVISAGLSPDGTRLMASTSLGPPLAAIDLASMEWESVDVSALDEIMEGNSPPVGANVVIAMRLIPWTDESTAWFFSPGGQVVRVTLEGADD